MRLKGKKVAMLVGPGYEDLEFWVVYMRMIEEGAEVKVVGLEKGAEYTSKSGGLKIKAEYTPPEIDSSIVDAVLIPGGWAPDKLRRDKSVLELVRSVYTLNKIVGMICHAGLVGISANIVNGKSATGSLGIKDDLENAGAIWKDLPAFREGQLVWGRIVKDIPAYCNELINAIANN